MDHNAVMKAYPNIVYLQSDFINYGLDDNGEKVIIEQSKVDAARVELDKLSYQFDRELKYPPLQEFADAMYWNSKGDSSKLTAYYEACEKVKTDYPKPS
tara:strand:- start:50 stop:346 length:297 start_codon:yes stop_codon:yes gene_type:complete